MSASRKAANEHINSVCRRVGEGPTQVASHPRTSQHSQDIERPQRVFIDKSYECGLLYNLDVIGTFISRNLEQGWRFCYPKLQTTFALEPYRLVSERANSDRVNA